MSTTTTKPKTRARLEILNYVTSFCLTRNFGEVQNYPANCAFVAEGLVRSGAQPGDLVALHCAPTTVWFLSWLHAIEERDGWTHYLLESIETGEQSWWTNVGLFYFERKTLVLHPEWRWTDEQFAFKARWWRACYKTRDAYMVRPCMPQFHDDGSVTLPTRISHGLGDPPPAETLPKWKQVKVRDMLAVYDAAVEWHEAEVQRRKVEREAREAAEASA